MRILTQILAAIGALAIVAAVAIGGYFFGGFHDVAASEEDNGAVAWSLIHVRQASLTRRAHAAAPIKLDDPAAVRDGARAFAAQGCANCHGAPGVTWAKFSEGLNPDPPDLKEIAKDAEPGQLFWVVRNGIRMTGMPSFNKAGASDGDIWKIVAFVKKLPEVSEADYKAWTTADSSTPQAQPAPQADIPTGSVPGGAPHSTTGTSGR